MARGNITLRVRIGADPTPTRSGGWMGRGFVNGARDPIEVRSDYELSEGQTVLVRPAENNVWRTMPLGGGS